MLTIDNLPQMYKDHNVSPSIQNRFKNFLDLYKYSSTGANLKQFLTLIVDKPEIFKQDEKILQKWKKPQTIRDKFSALQAIYDLPIIKNCLEDKYENTVKNIQEYRNHLIQLAANNPPPIYTKTINKDITQVPTINTPSGKIGYEEAEKRADENMQSPCSDSDIDIPDSDKADKANNANKADKANNADKANKADQCEISIPPEPLHKENCSDTTNEKMKHTIEHLTQSIKTHKKQIKNTQLFIEDLSKHLYKLQVPTVDIFVDVLNREFKNLIEIP